METVLQFKDCQTPLNISYFEEHGIYINLLGKRGLVDKTQRLFDGKDYLVMGDLDKDGGLIGIEISFKK